jgi:hypothetical protein
MVTDNYQEVELTTNPEKISKHGKHKNPNYQREYYLKNRGLLLAKKKLRHSQTYQKKPPKSPSLFLKNRERNLLTCLNKHHLTVPVPRFLKVKHPIIKGWNSPNYWYQGTIFELLAKNQNYFTLLNKDNSYQGVRIGCIDIDEKGWTKLPTKYWTCYISAGNGRIKVLFLYQDNCGLKTGKGYYQGQPILDFKISGGIMGIGSTHPTTNKPYSLKGVGSFFLANNKIFNSPYEIAELLKKDWGIEVLSIRERIIKEKEQEKSISTLELKELVNIPVKEPPKSYGKFFQNR